MKATVESTREIVTLNGIPARIWRGQTEKGVPVHFYVTRVAVPEDAASFAEFERDLAEQGQPELVAQLRIADGVPVK